MLSNAIQILDEFLDGLYLSCNIAIKFRRTDLLISWSSMHWIGNGMMAIKKNSFNKA